MGKGKAGVGRRCEVCGVTVGTARATALYCSNKCRQKMYRRCLKITAEHATRKPAARPKGQRQNAKTKKRR